MELAASDVESQSAPISAAPPAEPAGTRDTINAAVPLTPEQPRKPTTAEWLDGLERDLAAAETADAVDEIIARPQVQKALDALRNGALARLNAMIAEATKRTGDDDTFPGDLPISGEERVGA